MRTVLTWRPARSLAGEFSTRANSIGFLRLVLAVSVLVAHAGPLGYGRANYGFEFTRGQLDFGALGVNGFFVLSGFLGGRTAARAGAGPAGAGSRDDRERVNIISAG